MDSKELEEMIQIRIEGAVHNALVALEKKYMAAIEGFELPRQGQPEVEGSPLDSPQPPAIKPVKSRDEMREEKRIAKWNKFQLEKERERRKEAGLPVGAMGV